MNAGKFWPLYNLLEAFLYSQWIRISIPVTIIKCPFVTVSRAVDVRGCHKGVVSTSLHQKAKFQESRQTVLFPGVWFRVSCVRVVIRTLRKVHKVVHKVCVGQMMFSNRRLMEYITVNFLQHCSLLDYKNILLPSVLLYE